jgi:hypothetical protein
VKPGVILLNIMIGTLIASGIVIMLMTSLSQFISLDGVVMQDVNYLRRLIVSTRQLERDLSGAFVPHQAVIKKKKEEKSKQAPQKQGTQPQQTSSSKKEKKPLKDCFVLKHDEKTNNLELLTCITNNVMESYWYKEVGKPKPRITRVVYTLENDPHIKTAWRLMRQESSELVLKPYQKKKGESSIRSYCLLDHIASFKVRCRYQEAKKEEKKPAAQIKATPQTQKKEAPKKEPKVFKEITTWDDAMLEKKDALFISRLPEIIFIDCELFDENYKFTTAHTFTIPIISTGFNTGLKEKGKEAEQIPEEPKESKKSPEQNKDLQSVVPTTLTKEIKIPEIITTIFEGPIVLSDSKPGVLISF